MMRKNTLDLSYYSKNPLLFRKLKKRNKKHYRRPDASAKLWLRNSNIKVTIIRFPPINPFLKQPLVKEGKYRDDIRK